MRPGGESDKLGNRYEGLWTIYNLLSLLRRESSIIEVESLEDGIGVEFKKTRISSETEFHSVKIQTTAASWSPFELTKPFGKSRSTLGDLIGKLKTDSTGAAYFVSQISASQVFLICQDALSAIDLASFFKRMSADRDSDYKRYILPLCDNDDAKALNILKRLHVVTWTEPELREIVERDIAASLYRSDGQTMNPGDVRRLCGEIISELLGVPITYDLLIEKLKSHGLFEANWQHSPSLREKIFRLNTTYRDGVRRQLINGAIISRQEAKDAFDLIIGSPNRHGAFVGVAGLGKSCVTSELLDYLQDVPLPHLAIRLDEGFESFNPKELGDSFELPMSPADTLAAIAVGGNCVLILDQLDALSIISGRNQRMWHLIEELLKEANGYPNMRVWMACRAFDLDHDPKLRSLFERQQAQRINLRPLTPDEVIHEIEKAKIDPRGLDAKQIDLLRIPMHLFLYLEGDASNNEPFRTVQDLYNNYWDHKRRRVEERLCRSPRWNEVIDLLCDKLNENHSLAVPAYILDDCGFEEDVREMASANVLVLENKMYRFFHEGFFDYAFARRFERLGISVVELLIESGEQDLFRRSQVRQILTFLRDNNRARYLTELHALLHTEGVRTHIVKLVLEWLSSIPNPTAEELALIPLV